MPEVVSIGRRLAPVDSAKLIGELQECYAIGAFHFRSASLEGKERKLKTQRGLSAGKPGSWKAGKHKAERSKKLKVVDPPFL